jgi:hypothetical protein
MVASSSDLMTHTLAFQIHSPSELFQAFLASIALLGMVFILG